MYTIYINDTSLVITQSKPKNLENYQQIESQKFEFSSFYNRVKAKSAKGVSLLITENPKRLFKNIKKSLQLIEAAGGLVRNEENKYLFIFRKGKWDLPKGKLDAGEKTKKAAVREVEEECGIKVTKLGKKLCKTWHIYEMGGARIIKKTTWYNMLAIDQPNLVPQLEEDITKAEWVAPGDFKKLKKKTYPLINDMILRIES